MPRVNLPVQTLRQRNTRQVLAWVAADAANDHEFYNDGNVVVLVDNASGGNVTVVVTSVADQYGRLGDLTRVVAAGTIESFGPFSPKEIWNQSDGKVQVNVDAAASIKLQALSVAS